MVCIRADKKTLKLALFLTSHKDKCYFLGTVGTKVQAFYVTHDDLAAVKAAPIQNNKMVDSLDEFVTTSGRPKIEATPIYPLSQADYEKVFAGSDSLNFFAKLKDAQKAKGTPLVAHYLKCTAIKSSNRKQSILQVNIHDDCSNLPNKTQIEIATALETHLGGGIWEELKSFLKPALPWDKTLVSLSFVVHGHTPPVLHTLTIETCMSYTPNFILATPDRQAHSKHQ